MHELFRRGEVLPEGRTNEEEAELIEQRRREETRISRINPDGKSQMANGQ